jgi:mono/diheme cytochrome c family protein
MISKTFVSLIIPCVLITTSFCNDTEVDEVSFKIGENVYQETCASCHGENGQTNSKMKLIVNPRKLNKTILNQEQSYKIIKEGAHHWGAHSDMMPSFKYVYTEYELKSVAFYITNKFNKDAPKKLKKLLEKSNPVATIKKDEMLSTGKMIFKKNCSRCHGINGDGKSKYVEQSKNSRSFIFPYNLTRTLLNEDQIFLYAKYGGHFWGTDKDDMPSWKKKYDDFQLKSVARYIQKEIKKIKE